MNQEPKAVRPHNDRGQGRKRLIPGEDTLPFTVRVPESLHAKLLRLGGSDWLRKQIAKAREPA
jgi:hypothetical protein